MAEAGRWTTSLWSASGERSSMKTSTRKPTRRPGKSWVGCGTTSTSTIGSAHIRPWAIGHRRRFIRLDRERRLQNQDTPTTLNRAINCLDKGGHYTLFLWSTLRRACQRTAKRTWGARVDGHG